jgi:transposase InsO family protein
MPFHNLIIYESQQNLPLWTTRSADATYGRQGLISTHAGPGADPPFRSGSPYASHTFQAKLAQYGWVCSMSRKVDCWDIAPTESGFNSVKKERFFGERFAT